MFKNVQCSTRKKRVWSCNFKHLDWSACLPNLEDCHCQGVQYKGQRGHIGLMVSALDSRSSGAGFNPGRGDCIVGKTL